MIYVLNKSLEKNKKLELYSSGRIYHLCRDIRGELQRCSCNGYCEECELDMKKLERCKCEKTAVYDLFVKNRHGRRVSASFYKLS